MAATDLQPVLDYVRDERHVDLSGLDRSALTELVEQRLRAAGADDHAQ